MEKMKKTYSYEWYGPSGYEEKEDSKKTPDEVHDGKVFTSRVIPYERGFHVFLASKQVNERRSSTGSSCVDCSCIQH